MPQVFQVLRCFKCFVFQVHLTKKSNKWECKLCGIKQSIKRYYGLGTAKECRIHVQKLNVLRGEIDDSKINADSDEEIENEAEIKLGIDHDIKNESKWSSFVADEPVSSHLENETMYLGDAKVVLEVPKKKRKKFCTPTKSESYLVESSNKEKAVIISETKDHIQNCKEGLKSVVPIESTFSYRKESLDGVVENKTKKNDKTTAYSIKPIISLPNEVNSNSKWAQYVEHEAKETCTSQENIFSICDDETDIDNILDI